MSEGNEGSHDPCAVHMWQGATPPGRSRPPRAQKKTPASEEAGARIGLVAGEGFWRYLPVESQVTVQLPPLRGVREEDLVPTALAAATWQRGTGPEHAFGEFTSA